MELDKTLEEINKDRSKIEACFVFSLWKQPELYFDYINLNEGSDKSLSDPDAVFYYNLGKAMYKQGYREFDHVSLETFLENKPSIKKRYEEYGGYREIEQLKSIVSSNNTEAYFDKIAKMNSLTILCKKYNDMFSNLKKFDSLSSEQIYDTFEALNNSVSVATSGVEKVEALTVTDDFISALDSGENKGFNYGKYCPLLNYITLGAMPESMYMIGGHSGTGKSSFVFEAMLMGMHYSGISSAIISNEMNIDTYKLLLLEHVLTKDLNYYKLPRKQLRCGGFSQDQKEMISKAQEIIKEKYSDIKFIKTFDNDINKICKYIRLLSSNFSINVVFYDTFKADDGAAESQSMWQSLLMDSRKLFQTCSKYHVCLITTYQLALHTTNQRFLDATCLSLGKQIKEIYETMVYMRPVWDDEFSGEKYDIKPYKFNKNNSKIKEEIVMDKDKKYMLMFVDKTRSDEDKQVLLYEWKAHTNTWIEIGFARVVNTHNNY